MPASVADCRRPVPTYAPGPRGSDAAAVVVSGGASGVLFSIHTYYCYFVADFTVYMF